MQLAVDLSDINLILMLRFSLYIIFFWFVHFALWLLINIIDMHKYFKVEWLDEPQTLLLLNKSWNPTTWNHESFPARLKHHKILSHTRRAINLLLKLLLTIISKTITELLSFPIKIKYQRHLTCIKRLPFISHYQYKYWLCNRINVFWCGSYIKVMGILGHYSTHFICSYGAYWMNCLTTRTDGRILTANLSWTRVFIFLCCT